MKLFSYWSCMFPCMYFTDKNNSTNLVSKLLVTDVLVWMIIYLLFDSLLSTYCTSNQKHALNWNKWFNKIVGKQCYKALRQRTGATLMLSTVQWDAFGPCVFKKARMQSPENRSIVVHTVHVPVLIKFISLDKTIQ